MGGGEKDKLKSKGSVGIKKRKGRYSRMSVVTECKEHRTGDNNLG